MSRRGFPPRRFAKSVEAQVSLSLARLAGVILSLGIYPNAPPFGSSPFRQLEARGWRFHLHCIPSGRMSSTGRQQNKFAVRQIPNQT